jgi:hypothetical protein
MLHILHAAHLLAFFLWPSFLVFRVMVPTIGFLLGVFFLSIFFYTLSHSTPTLVSVKKQVLINLKDAIFVHLSQADRRETKRGKVNK